MGQEELDTLVESENSEDVAVLEDIVEESEELSLDTLDSEDVLDEDSLKLDELEESTDDSLELDAVSEESVVEEELTLEDEVQPEEELEVEDEEIAVEDELTAQEPVSEEENIVTPPPSTDEHKVVSQLDDVTRDSEIKAGEIFDKLEVINNFVGDSEEISTALSNTLKQNIELFEKLCEKFPNVESFKSALEDNQNALSKTEDIVQKSQDSADEVMMIMDIMQYQDIHRQKIERVINVMRTLSKYMSSLFASDVRDDNRASVANHIEGDDAETVSEDDIEALLASFGKK